MPGHVSWQVVAAGLLASVLVLALAVGSVFWMDGIWSDLPGIKFAIFLTLFLGYGFAWWWLYTRILLWLGGPDETIWP